MADSTCMDKAWRKIAVWALAYSALQNIFLGYVVPAIWL